jgi:hypothetical protein
MIYYYSLFQRAKAKVNVRSTASASTSTTLLTTECDLISTVISPFKDGKKANISVSSSYIRRLRVFTLT